MSDIVERLLDWSEHDEGKINDTRDEAAAEIARLRAEVEKVGRDYNTVHDAHDDWVRESERLRVEVKKMRADIAYADKHASKVEGLLWGTAKENEKLRAALEWYADTFCEGPAGPLCGKLDDTRCSGCKARAALEEK